MTSIQNVGFKGLAGDQTDSITIRGVVNAHVETGGGRDWIDVTTLAGGQVTIDAGTGDDRVNLRTVAGTKISVDLGLGNDSLHLTGAGHGQALAGAGNDIINVSLAGQFAIDGGEGTDAVVLSARRAETRLTAAADGGVLLASLDGTASHRITGVETIIFSDGTALSAASAHAAALSSGIMTGTNAAERVEIAEVDARRSASWNINLAGGNDSLDFTGARGITRLDLRTGDGDDSVRVSQLLRGGIVLGQGNDTISAALDGQTVIDGGAGNDLLRLADQRQSVRVTELSSGILELRSLADPTRVMTVSAVERFSFGGQPELSYAQLIAPAARPTVDALPRVTEVFNTADLAPLGSAWVAPASSARWSSTTGMTHINGSPANQTTHGTDGNNSFWSISSGATVAGAAGDDIYYNLPDRVRIIEAAGQGVDSVTYSGWYSIELPENVENARLLTASNQPLWGTHMQYMGYAPSSAATGNRLDNLLIGGAGDNRLDGRAGNDILTGGAGRDTFVFGLGHNHDRVTDFAPGTDKVRLINGPLAWDQVRQNLFDAAEGAVLRLSTTDTLTLVGRRVAELSASDFEFRTDLSRYRLTFADEFNSLDRLDGRSSDDGGIWRTRMHWDDGSRKTPEDSQAFVDTNFRNLGVNPFEVNNGVLSINGTWRPDLAAELNGREFVSGVISTQGSFAQQYGYFEARMKLPEWAGGFPAFWLLPTDLTWPPEIDIMEQLGGSPGRIHQMGQTVTIDTTQWHTYALEWTPERLAWFVNGEMTHVVYNHNQHKPMYIVLEYGLGSWAGTPARPAQQGGSAGTVEIDWVRAYELETGAFAQATITEGAPLVTYSIGALAVGQSAPAEDSWHHLASTTGRFTLSANDLNFASLPIGQTTVINERVDRTADSINIDVRIPSQGLNVQLSDSDGGNVILDDVALAEIRMGGARDSSVTLTGVQGGLVETGSGNDRITLSAPSFLFANRSGVTEVRTGAGDDSITGWNTIGSAASGTSNRMLIEAGPGNDTVVGSLGADIIAGGQGSDLLTGGPGRDVFLFRAGERGNDTITDFQRGQDRLVFEGYTSQQIRMSTDPAGLVLTTPDGMIFLNGVSQLTSSDMIFG